MLGADNHHAKRHVIKIDNVGCLDELKRDEKYIYTLSQAYP